MSILDFFHVLQNTFICFCLLHLSRDSSSKLSTNYTINLLLILPNHYKIIYNVLYVCMRKDETWEVHFIGISMLMDSRVSQLLLGINVGSVQIQPTECSVYAFLSMITAIHRRHSINVDMSFYFCLSCQNILLCTNCMWHFCYFACQTLSL